MLKKLPLTAAPYCVNLGSSYPKSLSQKLWLFIINGLHQFNNLRLRQLCSCNDISAKFARSVGQLVGLVFLTGRPTQVFGVDAGSRAASVRSLGLLKRLFPMRHSASDKVRPRILSVLVVGAVTVRRDGKRPKNAAISVRANGFEQKFGGLAGRGSALEGIAMHLPARMVHGAPDAAKTKLATAFNSAGFFGVFHGQTIHTFTKSAYGVL
jgi:hypothetical protein